MSRYVALLRGINVGGKNLIRMTALKECFEAQGFAEVVTYIASGNVLFTAGDVPAAELERRIEGVLARTFDYRASVVLRTREQMRGVVGRAPQGFGGQPAKYRYDVWYLKPSLQASQAVKLLSTKPGVDQVVAGTGVIYASRLISKATQSRLGKVVALPLYQELTIRNWNTTKMLLQLIEGER